MLRKKTVWLVATDPLQPAEPPEMRGNLQFYVRFRLLLTFSSIKLETVDIFPGKP